MRLSVDLEGVTGRKKGLQGAGFWGQDLMHRDKRDRQVKNNPDPNIASTEVSACKMPHDAKPSPFCCHLGGGGGGGGGTPRGVCEGTLGGAPGSSAAEWGRLFCSLLVCCLSFASAGFCGFWRCLHGSMVDSLEGRTPGALVHADRVPCPVEQLSELPRSISSLANLDICLNQRSRPSILPEPPWPYNHSHAVQSF